METIAELHQRALALLTALCTTTASHLEDELRPHRLKSLEDLVTRLRGLADEHGAGSDQQNGAYQAISDILWRLAKCFEQRGWDWSDLGEMGTPRRVDPH